MGDVRTRTVEWTDPSAVRAQAQGWTGLEIMQAIRDGRLPPPPMARLIGFRCVEAEAGRIVMELEPDQSVENTVGLVHGATAAAMLDTAMGAAAHTKLDAEKAVVTLDLHITYLRPVTVKSGPLRAVGVAVSVGARNAYVTGELLTGDGKLAAHAVGNFSIVGGKVS
ncbi:MAG: PaaI family thioesterase [Phenylobacterium zucineum]|nr:MAG: PaaI family thioesterase [Phenylobacterium zucineum]